MAPARWGRIGRLGEPKPDRAAVLVDAVDLVAVDLQFAEHDRWEVDPGLAQLGERHGLRPGALQACEQSHLLGFNEHHSKDCRPPRRVGRFGVERDG